jgi:hypothetical protein
VNKLLKVKEELVLGLTIHTGLLLYLVQQVDIDLENYLHQKQLFFHLMLLKIGKKKYIISNCYLTISICTRSVQTRVSKK